MKTKKKLGASSSPVNLGSDDGDANSGGRRRSDDGTSIGSSDGGGSEEQAAATDPLLPRRREEGRGAMLDTVVVPHTSGGGGSHDGTSPSSAGGSCSMRQPRPPPDFSEENDGGEELLRSGSWVLRLGGAGGSPRRHRPSTRSGHPPCCWSYGREGDGDSGDTGDGGGSWSFESASLLQVTHRPAHHAYPRHTNSALYRRFNPTASAKVDQRRNHGAADGMQHHRGGQRRPCSECRRCRCGDVCCSCCRGPTPYRSASSSSDSSPDGISREIYSLCDVESIRRLDENDLCDVDLTSRCIWPSGPGAAGILASGDVVVKWGGVRVRLHRHMARRRRASGSQDEDDFLVDPSPCDGAAAETDALDVTASSTTTTSASVIPSPAPPPPPPPMTAAEIELSPPPVSGSSTRTTTTTATAMVSTPSGPGLTSRHPLLIAKDDDGTTDGGLPSASSDDDDDRGRDHDHDDDEEVTVTFALPRLCRVMRRNAGPSDVDEEEEDATDALLSAHGSCGPPPLLWRASYPRDPALSIDSLTVFDGVIGTPQAAPSHVATDDYDDSGGGGPPTHVYVNGWQSWSFAGAVPRGEPQPSSAMPDFLSRAFNFGGSLPPRPSSLVVGKGAAGENGADGVGADDGGISGGGGRDLIRGATRIRRKASRVGHRLFDAYPGEDVAHRAATATATTVDTTDTRTDDPEWTYKSDLFACVTRNVTPDDDDDVLDSGISSSCTVGWLSQRRQFGLVAIDDCLTRCAMYCSCDGLVSSDGDAARRRMQQQTVGGSDGGDGCGGTGGHRNSSSSVVTTDWAWCQIQLRDVDDGDATTRSDRDADEATTAASPTSSAYDVVDHEPMADYLEAVGHYNDASRRAEVYMSPLSVGWCSWYHYYEQIDAATLVDNFSRMSKFHHRVGFNCSVVDDGYMTAWGDWDSLKPNKFDSGMRALADEMRERGMRPGLWMAPYAADKHSRLAKEHPDWLIRNHAGKVANSSNCGKFFYGLDGTNPEVRAHAAKIVRRAVRDWGYEVLKLDFLYGACLEGNGKFDLGMTRAETMYLSLRTLRDAAGPDVFLIGCGCPLGPAVGIVDGMRVSADTGPTWNPSFPLPWWDNSTLPCLRAMVRNSLTRAGMGHRWWHNDPDCLLLGESTDLTEEEVVSAATVIAMTGGMLLLSDDLTALSAERFDVATRIHPITGATAIPLDLHCSFEAIPSLMRLWCTDSQADSVGGSLGNNTASPDALAMNEGNGGPGRWVPPSPSASPRNCIHVAHGLGSWSIVSMSNWLDTDAVVSVPLSSLLLPHRLRNAGRDSGRIDTTSTPTTTTCNNGYHVFAFWTSKYVWIPPRPVVRVASATERKHTLSKRLCPHETEIFHLKPVSPRDNNLPQYIGSDLHFTCGHEVQSFVHLADKRSLIVTLKQYASCRPGSIFMYLPCQNVLDMVATVNGEPARLELMSTVPCGASLDAPNAAVAVLGCVVRMRIRAGGNTQSACGGVGGKIVVEF